MAATTDTSEGATLRDYLAVVWRRKWLVLLVIVVATGVAYGLSAMQTRMYSAASQLIYGNTVDVANPLAGNTYVDPTQRSVELESVGAVIAGPELKKRANALIVADLGAAALKTGYTVSSEVVASSDKSNHGDHLFQRRGHHGRQQ